MEIEYKTVGVTGVVDTSFKDGPGVVTAIVSVTGIRDNVGDIIEPGAYAESLAEITPKGAWHHDWTTPVSKTLEAIELMPGDHRLPNQLPNGSSWPKQAGALLIKTQFNLETQRGKDAYSDVKFFGDQQEWSIGYKVPEGGARHEKAHGTGEQTRYISRLKCYEYSPVLFGAMPAARTASVKDAQLSFKSLMGVDLDSFVNELAELEAFAENGEVKRSSAYGGAKQKISKINADIFDDDLYDDDEEDEDDLDGELSEEEKAMLRDLGITAPELRQAIGTMTKVLDFIDGRKSDGAGTATATLDDAVDAAMIELEALNYDTTVDAVASVLDLPAEVRSDLERYARQFDSADSNDDREALLDAIGDRMNETSSAAEFDGLRVTARVAGDLMEGIEGEKSSRIFGPEYKTLRAAGGRRARHEAYLLSLREQRSDVFDALQPHYPSGSGIKALISDIRGGHRIQPTNGFVIDTKALAEFTSLATVD